MSSAYRLHPESRYSSPPKLHHKLGLALAFIAFGSIAGAGGIVLHMVGNEPDSNGSPVIAAAPLKPSAAHPTSVAALPPPAVSAPKAPPSNPVQTAPVAAMIAAAPEPAPSAAPEPVAAVDAEPAMSAATEPPPPVAAANKPKNKARSQSRRERGWHDAYAWSPSAAYGRGRRDHWRPVW